MIAKSDVVNVRFRYENGVLEHISIARLPKGTVSIEPGIRFLISVNSDAAEGKEIDMVITSHSQEEQVSCRAVMRNTKHAPGLKRGWLSLVEVVQVQEHTVL